LRKRRGYVHLAIDKTCHERQTHNAEFSTQRRRRFHL
jgi:hypothetical protein